MAEAALPWQMARMGNPSVPIPAVAVDTYIPGQ
jgi:hypothetical protein